MQFANITGQLRGGPGKMTISDTTFTGPNGILYTLDILPPSLPPVVKLNRCTFVNSQLQFTDTYAVREGLHLYQYDNPGLCEVMLFSRGETRLTGNRLVFSGKRSRRFSLCLLMVSALPMFQAAGGLSLTGGSFSSVTQCPPGNLYPVDVEGGLMPGSTVPPTR